MSIAASFWRGRHQIAGHRRHHPDHFGLFVDLRIAHPVWMIAFLVLILLFLAIVSWIFKSGYRIKD